MGSPPDGYISVAKAAKILNRSDKSVLNWSRDGAMRRKEIGGRIWIHQGDVIEFKRLDLANEMRPGELARRLIVAERAIERLEKSIDMIFEVNNISSPKLAVLSDEQLLELFAAVADQIGEDEWTIDDLLSCCEVFIKLTENEVDRLNQLLKVDHSWKPFFELCLLQSRYINKHENLSHDLELQRVQDLLARGRQNLRAIAIVFIEYKATFNPTQKLLQIMAAADIDAYDELAKQSKERNSKGRHTLLKY